MDQRLVGIAGEPKALRFYRRMRFIRRFEETLLQLFEEGILNGTTLATYNSVSASGSAYFVPGDLGGSRTHTWFQLGVRAILFP